MQFQRKATRGLVVIIRWSKAGNHLKRIKSWGDIMQFEMYKGAQCIFPADEVQLTSVWALPRSATLANGKNSLKDTLGRYDKAVVAHPYGSAKSGESLLHVHTTNLKKNPTPA